MTLHDTLFHLGLLVLVAKLAEGLLRRIRLSPIAAYTLVGVLLGPVLGIVHPTEDLSLVLSIGIFLLFFLIGLQEIDIHAFVTTIRGRFFLAAIVSVVTSLLFALAVTSEIAFDFGLGLSLTQSLALAGILSMSSLGIVAKVLADEGRLHDPVGIQIFTTVLIAELVVLLLVGFTLNEHHHVLDWATLAVLLLKMAVFSVVTWLVSKHLIPRVIVLLQRVLDAPQLSLGLVLGSLLLVVSHSEDMEVHGSLAALLFGAALSGLPYQVRRELTPGLNGVADGIFVPLFFASAGLHLSLSFVHLHPLTIAAIVGIPLIGKLVGAVIGSHLARLQTRFTLATGLMAKGVAEIALLLLLHESGAIGADLFSLLVLVMILYIVVTPPLMSVAMKKVKPARTTAVRGAHASSVHLPVTHTSVGAILHRRRHHPSGKQTLRSFANRWIVPHQADYVVAEDGKPSGVLSLSDLNAIPKSAWDSKKLGDLELLAPPEASPDDHLHDVLDKMRESHLTAIPVVDPESGDLVGSVTSQEILELISLEAKGEH